MVETKASSLGREVPLALYLDAIDMGGTAAYATGLAVRLRKRGHEVSVLCQGIERGHPGRLSGETYLARLTAAGVAVHELSAGSRLTRVLQMRRLFFKLKRPVVILVMGYIDGGGPAAVAARLAGARAVIRAELQPPMPPLTAAEVRSARYRDHLVDLVVVGSEENRRMLRDVMRRKCQVTVVNSGIDLELYVPGAGRAAARQELGCGPDQLLVGVIARLVARKGVADFITASDRVARRHSNARFVVVGDGPERDALEAQARGAAAARFIFAGTRKDIRPLLAALDVLVVPSHFEGGPLILLEGMAMALPVVSTRVGMAAEVIEPGRCGLLVEPRDTVDMANAVSVLLADREERARLGQAARWRIQAGLTLDDMVDGYLRVCASAASRRWW